jgi:hypothetical protein
MALLQETAHGVDHLLEAAVERQLERAVSGHTYETLEMKDESRLQAGNLYVDGAKPTQPTQAGHSYKNITSSGKAKGLLGDQYGGKGFWD